MNDTTPPDQPERVYEILSGNVDALAAMEAVIARAKRRLLIFDVNLKDRGYNSPRRYEALRALLLSDRNNRIQIALHDTQGLEGDCPRLMMLLQQFPTSIRIHRTVGVAREANDPVLIADEEHYWHKLHYQHPRSVLSLGEATDAKPLIERFDEIWESSEPAVSGSTSGL